MVLIRFIPELAKFERVFIKLTSFKRKNPLLRYPMVKKQH